MSYDYLRSYSVPSTSSHHHRTWKGDISNYEHVTNYSDMQHHLDASTSLSCCDNFKNDYHSYHESEHYYYQGRSRFVSPGKQGTRYFSPAPRPQKRKYSAGPGVATKVEKPAEVTPDGRLAIFQGRDTSYPDDLNRLIHPLSCELCGTQMNSLHSAKDHYESRPHDRNITNWLTKNYTEKGLTPPPVKRFLRQGPAGPNAFHCELCDLKLTSLMHANQHYAGRKHRLVACKISKPSGAGYYNDEGKWVRTSTKVLGSDDKRIGSAEQAKVEKITKSLTRIDVGAINTSSTPDTTTPPDGGATNPVDESMFCKVCNVSVTSTSQMAMHLEGSKHQKKLKLKGGNLIIPTLIKVDGRTEGNSILSSLGDAPQSSDDLSMYRTPTGSYYCKTCNTSMSHITVLQQHLYGRKHVRKSTESKLRLSAPTNIEKVDKN